MRTKGYVLKVAVASAAIGSAAVACGKTQEPVGMVAVPPAAPIGSAASSPEPSAAPSDTPVAVPAAIGSSAPAPDTAVDAGRKPHGHKVGSVAPPPDLIGPTVGTTAHAPDSKP